MRFFASLVIQGMLTTGGTFGLAPYPDDLGEYVCSGESIESRDREELGGEYGMGVRVDSLGEVSFTGDEFGPGPGPGPPRGWSEYSLIPGELGGNIERFDQLKRRLSQNQFVFLEHENYIY